MSALIARKIGMTRLFDENGNNVPVTILEAGPCFVTQVKTKETDGYDAVQLGYDEKREKLVRKPMLGHLKKANVPPVRILKEFKEIETEQELTPGAEIKVDQFEEGDLVTITGTSKGRGFQGGMKRHGFSGAQKTHGQSDRMRAPGSIGQSSYPSRVLKGTRMAGRMGNDRVTLKKVRVIKVDPANNLLIVKGAIPGANQGIIYIKKQ